MGFKTDIEIAQECTMEPITKIAEKAGIDDKYLEQYGKYKAKIDYNLLNESDAPNGKLILVTAIMKDIFTDCSNEKLKLRLVVEFWLLFC